MMRIVPSQVASMVEGALMRLTVTDASVEKGKSFMLKNTYFSVKKCHNIFFDLYDMTLIF